MRTKRLLGSIVAAFALSAPAVGQDLPLVTLQPDPGTDIAKYITDPISDRPLSYAEMAALVRKNIKYVFVIFNENHSFDNEFGTFPGVDGLYSDGSKPRPAAATPGLVEAFTDIDGRAVSIEAFGTGPRENATFTDSVDHSHKGLAAKLHVVDGIPKMDRFAETDYRRFARKGDPDANAKGLQFARLVMSHMDCDTIPFMWHYASRFTIFDRIFATEDTPSTPNAVAMIAGQAGETQWVEHADQASTAAVPATVQPSSAAPSPAAADPAAAGRLLPSAVSQTTPLVNDPNPFWGSPLDTTAAGRQPVSSSRFEPSSVANTAVNLTFASAPLTAMGAAVAQFVAQDRDPAANLADVGRDIAFIRRLGRAPTQWRWYQNGYDLEPSDGGGVASHRNYVAHHQGPQYFGYVADNPAVQGNLRGLGDFFTDVRDGRLPPEGGVFYVRGGFGNIFGHTPPIQNPRYPNPDGLSDDEIAAIRMTKGGDDDHPAYADRQISEAMNAKVVNAIAARPEIWAHSAIIVTYDESDGFYDHVAPRILSYGPDMLPLARGIRVPLIVVSPFARAHAVSHAEGDHNAVIETVNAVFDLPALSSLPDEAAALAAGNSAAFNRFAPAGFQQRYLGPRDTPSPITDSLLSAFDPQRLRGERPPLPAEYARIPDQVIDALPHFGGQGCRAVGIVPEDRRQGLPNRIPPGFNTLPSTLPKYN